MYDRITVPLDGSPFSEQALPLAASIARHAGAELHAVQVHGGDIPVEFVVGLPSFDWVDDQVRDQERQYLDRVAERLTANGLRVRASLLEGKPSEAIVDYITDEAIDLVVMSTHGRSLPSRAWLGSVADRLVRSAPAPLLLIRTAEDDAADQPIEQFRHILVPLDGSELAERVIEHAAALATLFGARCTLFAAVPPQFEVGAHVFYLDAQEREHASANAEEYLARIAEQLRASVPETDTRAVVHALPATAIVDAAAEVGADLIAMATHGRGGISRLVLGSTADKVLRSTETPLFLHRPE